MFVSYGENETQFEKIVFQSYKIDDTCRKLTVEQAVRLILMGVDKQLFQVYQELQTYFI